jgi:acetyltransferase-like isoleucine patch superfamily enzyme
MFDSRFLLNPIRTKVRGKYFFLYHPLFAIRQLFIKVGLYCGFTNIDYSYVHGDKKRVHLGVKCSTMNSIINVISGEVFIGDNTILGHNCMLLTGTHLFERGTRKSLNDNRNLKEETPSFGRDIKIGSGCFIGSGVVIVGPVTIGNNVIIGAGSVVTKPIPDSFFAAGIPAKIINKIVQ